MVRQSRTRVQRERFASKDALLAGGADVRALRYQRASQDKKEQGKSVGDQDDLNIGEVRKHRWTDAGSYTDNDLSSSRHARKGRPDFEKLLEEIAAGAGDVLVVWEIGRSQRDLAVFVQIRDMCVEVGLRYWLLGGVLYDLTDRNDRMMLGFLAVQSEFQADYIRDNVKRGIDGAAAAGLPHGHITYGYRRIYDQRTKALLRQEADDEVREATSPHGIVSTYTRAGIVKEIFARIAAGDAISALTNDLNDRGIPSPGGVLWIRTTVRAAALRDAYLGKRVLRGEVVGEGQWPALVDEEQFWACRRILEAPERTTTKPGKARYLLSYIAVCAVCGSQLATGNVTRHMKTPMKTYRCKARQCVAVRIEYLDEYVERIVVAFLSRPQVLESLHQSTDDKETAHARAEAERLHGDLEDARKLASTGQLKPIDFVRIEAGLSAQIEQWEAKAKDAGISPVLRGRFGPHAEDDWLALGDNIAVKREIIRAVLAIELGPALNTAKESFTPERVGLRWLIGPDADTTPRVWANKLSKAALRSLKKQTTSAP